MQTTISQKEMALCRRCLEMALDKGASKVRITMDKSTMDLVATLNGAVDKVTHCLDESISIVLFVDGKYGTYSTNRLDEEQLDSFLDGAISTTGMLCADECRDLPRKEKYCRNALGGDELAIFDRSIESMGPEQRLEMARQASIFGKTELEGKGYELVSEEGEYSDSLQDTYVIDSEGLSCRHIETSFEYWVEMTIQTSDGDRWSGSWWESAPMHDDLSIGTCAPKALEIAAAQIGPKKLRSGKYNIVIDTEVAERLVSPILKALNAYAIQQSNSFLKDSLGKQVFPEGLTIMDCCHDKGKGGARLFDSEGVATLEGPIIDKGVVDHWFINSYMALKMQLEPTFEEAIRPKVMPFPDKGLGKDDIMALVGDGVLITDFNGGNCNPVTGDFSYGVEGFVFKKGRITHPFRESVLTGNILDLWSRMLYAGDDCRACNSRIVPTLAFAKADLSA